MYSIRHYIIKYIDMIIINYDYRIYCFDIGKMVVFREHNMSYLNLGMTVCRQMPQLSKRCDGHK